MISKKTRKFIKFFLIVLLIFTIDRVSKGVVLHHFTVGGDIINVLPIFGIVLVWNDGISFGMLNDLQEGAVILSILSLTVVIILILWYNLSREKGLMLPISMIVGGALGNISDRILYGAVLDFIDLYWNDIHYPAFNIADMSIVFGVLICLFMDIKKHMLKSKANLTFE